MSFSKKKLSLQWIEKGLPFQCTQCGKCCTGSPGFVWVTDKEIVEMAEFLKISSATFKRLYVRRIENRYTLVERKSQNHSCIFYQNQKCQVYAARPLQCRAYPFWQENLLTEQNWASTAQECEGIYSDAPLIPIEKIEAFLEQQRLQAPPEHFVSSHEEESDL